MTKIKVSAFKWVPPIAQGLVRDLRVRWALEEAGLDYEIRLIGFGDQSSEDYRALQPFGKVPSFEADGLVLFESGSIVLHIAESSAILLPVEPEARARVKTWIFAALNTVEPPTLFLFQLGRPAEGETPNPAREAVVGAIRKRFQTLSDYLDGKEYLVDSFSAADLLMSSVLRSLRSTDIVAEFPILFAYLQRCQERPAFKKALADQLAVFAEHAPN